MTAKDNNDAWTHAPNAAAQVVRRAMHERDWTQADVAHATGLGTPVISRWSRGVVNPPDARVAEVAARLGYDPRDFGINTPSALARAREHRPQDLDDAPAWARRHHTELMTELRIIREALRAG